MKLFTILFTLILFYGCKDYNDNTVKKEPNYFYVSYSKRHKKLNTLQYEQLNIIDSIDELLATEDFEYKNITHTIQMYSSDNKAPADGGELKYTLDSIGIIYRRSIWWPNFDRLSSNNDSVNDLISTAFGFILIRKSLRCFYCDEEYTHKPIDKSIQFTTPR